MINLYEFDEKYINDIKKVYEVYENEFGLKGQIDVDVICADKNFIQQVNKLHRNVDRVTDVLSFPSVEGIELPLDLSLYEYEIDRETGRLFLGEIIICIDKVLEQAVEYGNTPQRELTYLTAHGLLHLLGYDHEDEQEKNEMRKQEEKLLSIAFPKE